MCVICFFVCVVGFVDCMVDFIVYLWMNGLCVGLNDIGQVLLVFSYVDVIDVDIVCEVLVVVLVLDVDEYGKFDDLFDVFWFNVGKKKMG